MKITLTRGDCSVTMEDENTLLNSENGALMSRNAHLQLEKLELQRSAATRVTAKDMSNLVKDFARRVAKEIDEDAAVNQLRI